MRVAELLGSLSLATDLADGFSLEKCLRTSILATRLAGLETSDPGELRLCFWSGLLRFVGCTAFAHEEGRDYAAGDDLSLRRSFALADMGDPRAFVAAAVKGIAPAAPLGQRVRALGSLFSSPGAPKLHALAQCDAGVAFAHAVGMPELAPVLRLREERWDGRGPRALAREESLPLAARACDVADVAELFAWNFSYERAIAELRHRAGGALDPGLVERFTAHGPELFRDVFATSVWELFLATEPAPHLVAEGPDAQTRYLGAFAHFADLSSVYTLGHSRRVAELAAGAARALALAPHEQTLALHAGLAHDLGRVALPVGLWEKRGALSPYERERVRAHSQHTETILRLAPALEGLADVSAATHERGTGRGYHRRLRAGDVSIVARALAAADVYVALESDRPHRPRFTRENAERELLAMARSNELDALAVRAVLDAAGAPREKLRALPRGLTERELEVVRLVAVGRTNPELGKLLGISARTAQKHVMNIYAKAGVESRAGLALFAVEHGLLEP